MPASAERHAPPAKPAGKRKPKAAGKPKPDAQEHKRSAAPSGLKTAGFYRITDLAKPDGLTGLGRSTLYDMSNAGTFPAPVKLTAQVSGWPVPAVNAWLAARGALPAASDARG